MDHFDDLIEEIINGKFYAVVIDSETSNKYLLADIVVETSISGLEGIKSSIRCLPDRSH